MASIRCEKFSLLPAKGNCPCDIGGNQHPLGIYVLQSQENVAKELRAHLNNVFPFPKIMLEKPITEVDLPLFDRKVWYCNASGREIPILNAICGIRCSKSALYRDDEDEDEDELPPVEDPKRYRVYPCGHAFYDEELQDTIISHCIGSRGSSFVRGPDRRSIRQPDGSLLANHWSHFDLQNYRKELKDLTTQCPICQEVSSFSLAKLSDRGKIYSVDLGQGGTIISGQRIPKKYLNLIKSEFRAGDYVDTEGYRGTGLYIYDGTNWKPQPRYEYYPVWERSFLEERGYAYYLLSWRDSTDGLEFANGVGYYPRGERGQHFHSFDHPDKPDTNHQLQPTEYLKYERSSIINGEGMCVGTEILSLFYGGQWHTYDLVAYRGDEKNCHGGYGVKEIQGEYSIEFPYPFESPEQARAFENSPVVLRTRLNEHEELYMGSNFNQYDNLVAIVSTDPEMFVFQQEPENEPGFRNPNVAKFYSYGKRKEIVIHLPSY